MSLPATAHPWHDPGPRGTASNLDNIDSSYQFHRELESPVAFMRREWRALVIFGGGFVAVLLVGVLAVDPAYFYPRLATDPLHYYLKGLAFAGTGHVIARSAVNSEPFHYVSMPGMLRSPFIAAFRNFGDQLRAIQVANIALVTATAAMFSYVLSWAVSRARHWMAIGYAFGFILLSSAWVANVFAPLADAPYEAFTIAALIIVTRVICSDRPIRSRPFAIAGAAILFAPCALLAWPHSGFHVHDAVLVPDGDVVFALRLRPEFHRRVEAGLHRRLPAPEKSSNPARQRELRGSRSGDPDDRPSRRR